MFNAEYAHPIYYLPPWPHSVEEPRTRERRVLKVIPLPGNTLRLALTNNPLPKPLGSKAPTQRVKILHNILAAQDDRLLGCLRPIGCDAQLEGRKERVGDFVRREGDILVFVEALREQVAERVVFLIESKNGGVGGAWAGLSQLLRAIGCVIG
jgi:hypothetical protein